ncbi:MAG: 16S rRNA (cytidine(1402)-2'-O)-methyltransferase [Deltaproteobacteria bacterium]
MQSDERADLATTPQNAGTLCDRVTEDLHRQLAAELPPGLYIVATPIGNLADITLRALAALARADVIYCEDTRHSRHLLAHFGISRPLRPYHEHNADEQRPRILADLSRQSRIALISDAGTPLISDPGYKLVRDCIAQGHAVTTMPGASAILTSLAVAGLPTDTFMFAGFLPPRTGARQSRIAELAAVPATLVFFEAPTRLAGALSDLASGLGNRPAVVARELTKLHEEVARGTLSSLAAAFSEAPPKGEIVILVAAPEDQDVSDERITDALAQALEHMSLRDAAKVVADRFSVPKARVYDLGLKIRSSGSP